jgi:hypothetical protein
MMQPQPDRHFHRTRALFGGAVPALVIAGAVLVIAPGSASAKSLAPGNVTCHASGGFTTSPGISAAGTPGKKLEVMITTKLDGCESQSGAPVPKVPEAVTNKTIKLPPDPCLSSCTKANEVVGKASDLAQQLGSAMLKQKIQWGPSVKSTKAIDKVALNPQPLPPGQCAATCEGTLQLKSVQSSAGPFDLTEFLDPASTQNLNNLIGGIGAPVSSFSFDTKTGSATEGSAVLTYGSAAGPNVQVGDVITVPSFTIPGTCSGGSLKGFVTTNPSAPGTAEISVTVAKLIGCSSPSGTFTPTLTNLAYPWTMSDNTGDPFVLSGMELTFPGLSGDCTYFASMLTGTYSNATNTGTASAGQTLGNSFGGLGCPDSIPAGLSIGPVEDASQTGSPVVFVN